LASSGHNQPALPNVQNVTDSVTFDDCHTCASALEVVGATKPDGARADDHYALRAGRGVVCHLDLDGCPLTVLPR
jgi:hypothetical protein